MGSGEGEEEGGGSDDGDEGKKREECGGDDERGFERRQWGDWVWGTAESKNQCNNGSQNWNLCQHVS